MELGTDVFEVGEGELFGIGSLGDGDIGEGIVEDVAVRRKIASVSVAYSLSTWWSASEAGERTAWYAGCSRCWRAAPMKV